MTASEPTALVSASSPRTLARDPATSSFEEVETMLEREATMGGNKIASMAVAGGCAALLLAGTAGSS
ncbi:MAG TPA: hypothetical protein VG455_16535 [Acidimicrobiales bacterium]|nr:hypothetical protein [Acidimicrobiales bacterium]